MPSVTVDDTSTYRRLKLLILGGEIGVGEPLVERSIAERLGVSRTPVRETIFKLEREGLVRVIEGKGAFVASYSIEDLVEIYHVREGLEPIAARLACAHIDLADLRRFEEEFKRYRADSSRRTRGHNAWVSLGREFHTCFIRASHNRRLIQMIDSLQDQIELFRGLGRTISPNAVSVTTIDEHMEILQGLKARDPDRAEKAVRVHLRRGLQYRIEGLQLAARSLPTD